MTLSDYYEKYWRKRGRASGEPIRSIIPSFLRPFSQYGAVVSQVPFGSKILDLGCGDGNVTQLFQKKGPTMGVDISQQALKLANKRGIETKLHDLNRLPLPFKDRSFDVVILTDTLEHLLDPLAVLEDCRRILNKGGRVIITVPNFARLENRLKMLRGDPVDILQWGKYGDGREHFHWFTKGKIERFLNQANFKKIKFAPTGLLFGFIWGKLGFPGLAKMLTIVGEKH